MRVWLTKNKSDIRVEIKWCSSHRGMAGNEKADEWAKVAAETPGEHEVEWKRH